MAAPPPTQPAFAGPPITFAPTAVLGDGRMGQEKNVTASEHKPPVSGDVAGPKIDVARRLEWIEEDLARLNQRLRGQSDLLASLQSTPAQEPARADNGSQIMASIDERFESHVASVEQRLADFQRQLDEERSTREEQMEILRRGIDETVFSTMQALLNECGVELKRKGLDKVLAKRRIQQQADCAPTKVYGNVKTEQLPSGQQYQHQQQAFKGQMQPSQSMLPPVAEQLQENFEETYPALDPTPLVPLDGFPDQQQQPLDYYQPGFGGQIFQEPQYFDQQQDFGWQQQQQEQQLEQDQPQYEMPQYGETQFEQPQYGEFEQVQYAQPQYEQPRYEKPQYEQPQHEQPQYEQPQYEQPQYEQLQLHSHCEQPHHQPPFEQLPFEQAQLAGTQYNQVPESDQHHFQSQQQTQQQQQPQQQQQQPPQQLHRFVTQPVPNPQLHDTRQQSAQPACQHAPSQTTYATPQALGGGSIVVVATKGAPVKATLQAPPRVVPFATPAAAPAVQPAQVQVRQIQVVRAQTLADREAAEQAELRREWDLLMAENRMLKAQKALRELENSNNSSGVKQAVLAVSANSGSTQGCAIHGSPLQTGTPAGISSTNVPGVQRIVIGQGHAGSAIVRQSVGH